MTEQLIPMGQARVQKVLVDLGDKHAEAIYFNRPEKQVVCFSTQLSCAVGCTFCASPGPEKTVNLTYGEMLHQCHEMLEDNLVEGKVILFSFMGEGEPLLNYSNVVTAMQLLPSYYPNCRLALSTSGAAPKRIVDLSREEFDVPFKLQVSMHSLDSVIRKELMPLASPIEEVIAAMETYRKNQPNRSIELNFALMDGINDRDEDLELIKKYLDTSWYLKFGRFNLVSGVTFTGSNRIQEFVDILTKDGYIVEYHASDGANTGAACGQTRGEYVAAFEK